MGPASQKLCFVTTTLAEMSSHYQTGGVSGRWECLNQQRLAEVTLFSELVWGIAVTVASSHSIYFSSSCRRCVIKPLCVWGCFSMCMSMNTGMCDYIFSWGAPELQGTQVIQWQKATADAQRPPGIYVDGPWLWGLRCHRRSAASASCSPF